MMLRLGTRGSALARWQAGYVTGRLRAAGHEVEVVFIKTSGDLRQDVPLSEISGKGVFVKEIEMALLSNEIDIAVHSAKDLPSYNPPGLTLAAFCERADPRDAFVSRYGSLEGLPEGARIATSAPRRIAQILHRRPDLKFVAIRGNVDTRLKKLADGEADALILACAGLDRLGRSEVIRQRISEDVVLPQVGQGCVAVQCRESDAEIQSVLAEVCDHEQTRLAVTAERAFLSLIGGGCTAPVAGHAYYSNDRGILAGLVATPDGSQMLFAAGTADKIDLTLAQCVYDRLLAQGAASIITSP